MSTSAAPTPTDLPTAWKEVIPPDEDARFRAFAEELREMAARRAARRKQAQERVLHVKLNVAAVGELVVGASVPALARVGVFAEPGRRWPVYLRFSNGASERQPDGSPDLRGLALKLVGVPGDKIIPGLEKAQTQDFLFINVPAVPFRTPDEFLAFLRSTQKGPLWLVPKLIGALGLFRALSLVKSLAGLPKPDSLGRTTFHTAAAMRMGQTAAQLRLDPIDPPPAVPLRRAGDVASERLRHELVSRMGQGPMSFRLSVQLFQDERTTPIEDSAVPWPQTPRVEVGTLTVPRQDVTSPGGQAIEKLVERLSFDPWHALPEHRPLGAVMRARAHAYRESVIARGAADEPTAVLPPG